MAERTHAETALSRERGGSRTAPRRRVQRQPPSLRLRICAFGVALGLHALAAVELYRLMRPQPSVDDDRVVVRLLAAPSPAPALPEPPPRARATTARAVAAGTHAPATQFRSGTAQPSVRTEAAAAPTPDVGAWFNSDGSVRLAPAPEPSPHEVDMRRAAELLSRGHNVLHCVGAAGRDGGHHESLGDELARRYLSILQLYNPHSEWKTQMREAAASAACDDSMHRRSAAPSADAE